MIKRRGVVKSGLVEMNITLDLAWSYIRRRKYAVIEVGCHVQLKSVSRVAV